VRLLSLASLGAFIQGCAESPLAPVDPTGMTLLIVNGDHQSGPAGTELPLPLTVKAISPAGGPLAGIVVNFRVTSGGGTLFAGSSLTDRLGRASDFWTLGPDPGVPQTLEVRGVTALGDKEVFARFSATATQAASRTKLAAGSFQSCAVASDGHSYCWGDNVAGDLGDGTTFSRSVPTLVAGGVDFVSLSGGYWHSCGLTASGVGYCWGFNAFGDLGDGTNTSRVLPTPIAGGLRFEQLETRTWGGCGLIAGGAAYCWGNNDNGVVGDGTTMHRNTPVPVIGGLHFTSIVAGANTTCGLVSGGQAYCWGQNNIGQLGDGTLTDRYQPTAVSGGISFNLLALGYSQTCGLTAAGVAYCWGDNRFGQAGDGSTTSRMVPTRVAGGLTFRSLIGGGFHTCGILTSGAAVCWGRNSPDDVSGGGGQLGDGTTTDRLVPTATAGGLSFSALAAGESHTCGQTLAGSVWCWGNNASGQLGDGSNTNRLVPVAVTGGLLFPAGGGSSLVLAGRQQ
jgi:alpha-tubulin suppressor-like RCC1 family protein